jgi:hypothetical protein
MTSLCVPIFDHSSGSGITWIETFVSKATQSLPVSSSFPQQGVTIKSHDSSPAFLSLNQDASPSQRNATSLQDVRTQRSAFVRDTSKAAPKLTDPIPSTRLYEDGPSLLHDDVENGYGEEHDVFRRNERMSSAFNNFQRRSPSPVMNNDPTMLRNVQPSVMLDIGTRIPRGPDEIYGSHFFIPDCKQYSLQRYWLPEKLEQSNLPPFTADTTAV